MKGRRIVVLSFQSMCALERLYGFPLVNKNNSMPILSNAVSIAFFGHEFHHAISGEQFLKTLMTKRFVKIKFVPGNLNYFFTSAHCA